MALRVLGSCFGCGACESACPSAAISQAGSFVIVYVVDPLLCNDCLDCVRVCPVDALVPDPDWAVCLARGCPLASRRYHGWECSQGPDRCPTCGSMLWRAPDGEWACSACRSATGIRMARCPKTELARRAELTRSDPVPPA